MDDKVESGLFVSDQRKALPRVKLKDRVVESSEFSTPSRILLSLLVGLHGEAHVFNKCDRLASIKDLDEVV